MKLKQYKKCSPAGEFKLKKLGKQIGLPIPLTSYVARHASASIARSKNIPLATISEAWDMIQKALHGFILHR